MVGQSQAYDTVSGPVFQVLQALEVLKQVCLTHVGLASGQSSVHDLVLAIEAGRAPRELMALGSIYAVRLWVVKREI